MNINPNLLTGTRYFSGSDWVNLDITNLNLDYNIVPGFAVYRVSNQDWSGLTQYIKVYAGETYTFSLYFRYNGVSDDYLTNQTYVYIELDNKGMDQERLGVWGADVTVNGSNLVAYVNNKFVRIHYTFKVTKDGYIKPRVERGIAPNIEIQEYGLKLERGSEMTPYCGTVEEGGGDLMLKDELTGLADNIRSHTGYNEKMNVPEMKDHVKNLSWVNHNLLSGTSDHYRTLAVDSGFMCKSTASSFYNYTYGAKPGDWYTYSATISNYSSTPISLELWLFKDGSDCKHDTEIPYPINAHSEVVNPGEYDKDVSGYIQVGKTSNQIRTYIIVSNGAGVKGEQIQVKNERLYKGRQPGVWTPNSVDSTTSNGTFTASTLDRSLSSFNYHDLDVARGTNSSYIQSHLVNYNSSAQAYRFNFSSTGDHDLQVYPSNNRFKNIPAGEKVKQEVIITTDASQIKKAGFDFFYNGQSHVYQATVEQIALNTYRLTACWEAEETVNLYMYNLYHLDLKSASYLDVSICNSWIYTGTSIGWELSPVMNLLYDTDNMTDDSVWAKVGNVTVSSIKVQGSNNKIGSYYFTDTGTGRAQPIYLQNGVDYTISAYVQTNNDAKIALLLDNTTPYMPDPIGGSIERAVIKYDFTTDPYFDIKGNPNMDHFRRIGYHFNVSKDGYVTPRVELNSLNNGSQSTTIRYGGLQLSTNQDVPPYYTSQAGEKLCDMTGVNMLHDTQTLKDWTLDGGGDTNHSGVSIINGKEHNSIRLTGVWQEAYQDTDLLLRGTRYTYSYNLTTPVRMNWYLRNTSGGSFLPNVVRADGEILNNGDTSMLDISVSDTLVDTADSNIPFTFGYGTPNTEWKDNTNSAYLSLPTTYYDGEIVTQDTDASKIMYALLSADKSYTQTIWVETDCNVDLDASMCITWFTIGDGHDVQPATVIKLDAVHYKIISTYKLENKKDYRVRLFDMSGYDQVFKIFNSGTYFKITRCKIQSGTRSTDETPLESAKRKSITLRNNSNKGMNSVRLFGTQINNDYAPTVSYLYLPKLEIGHKPTFWTEGGGRLGRNVLNYVSSLCTSILLFAYAVVSLQQCEEVTT